MGRIENFLANDKKGFFFCNRWFFIAFINSFYSFELCFIVYKIGVGGSFGLGIRRLGLQRKKEKVTEARWGETEIVRVSTPCSQII